MQARVGDKDEAAEQCVDERQIRPAQPRDSSLTGNRFRPLSPGNRLPGGSRAPALSVMVFGDQAGWRGMEESLGG